MKPGMTTLPRASISAAFPTCRFLPMAFIVLPSTSTSPSMNSPNDEFAPGVPGSIVIT